MRTRVRVSFQVHNEMLTAVINFYCRPIMKPDIPAFLNRKFPRNFLFRNPVTGSLAFVVFIFAFMLLYKPFNVHGARSLGLFLTMAAYCLIFLLIIASSIWLIKKIPYFSNPGNWSVARELLSTVIVLVIMGLTVYFAGFIIETPSNRWNVATFINSFTTGMLIGIVPLAFFTLANYRHFFAEETLHFTHTDRPESDLQKKTPILIESQLKKEELSFYPDQLIYAESDGNYVEFHLDADGSACKKTVRNSISNIEEQLSEFPYLMRTHRAFIVNLHRVDSKKGNSLGYKLKISGTDAEIPVSRQNTKAFDEAIAKNI